MTEQEKEILKESTHILGKYGYSNQENQLKEIIKPKPKRYHIDVRIECDKVGGIEDLHIIDVKTFINSNSWILPERNATITEIPLSETVLSNQIATLNTANAKLHQINKDLELENEKLKEALNKIKFIYSNY